MLGLNSWSVLTLRTHVYCVINVTMCLFVCLFVCLFYGRLAHCSRKLEHIFTMKLHHNYKDKLGRKI